MRSVEPVYVEIGQRIQYARKRRDCTQAELAKAIGIDRPGLSLMENGKRRVPVHLIVEIAETLNTPLDALLAHYTPPTISRSNDGRRLHSLLEAAAGEIGVILSQLPARVP